MGNSGNKEPEPVVGFMPNPDQIKKVKKEQKTASTPSEIKAQRRKERKIRKRFDLSKDPIVPREHVPEYQPIVEVENNVVLFCDDPALGHRIQHNAYLMAPNMSSLIKTRDATDSTSLCYVRPTPKQLDNSDRNRPRLFYVRQKPKKWQVEQELPPEEEYVEKKREVKLEKKDEEKENDGKPKDLTEGGGDEPGDEPGDQAGGGDGNDGERKDDSIEDDNLSEDYSVSGSDVGHLLDLDHLDHNDLGWSDHEVESEQEDPFADIDKAEAPECCFHCGDLEAPLQAPCGHIGCKSEWMDWIDEGELQCPDCEKDISADTFQEINFCVFCNHPIEGNSWIPGCLHEGHRECWLAIALSDSKCPKCGVQAETKDLLEGSDEEEEIV